MIQRRNVLSYVRSVFTAARKFYLYIKRNSSLTMQSSQVLLHSIAFLKRILGHLRCYIKQQTRVVSTPKLL